MASRQCIVNILDLFVRSKPGARLDDPDKVVEAWALVLDPLPDDVVKAAAVNLARRDGDFMPSAGAVYQGALSLMDDEPSADDAWMQVLEHAKRATLGNDNPVKLEGRTERALELIGGDVGWNLDEIQFRRREFVQVYDSLEKQWRNQAALPGGPQWKQLPG